MTDPTTYRNGMPILTMSKARALEIQAEQVAQYAAVHGPHVPELVATATTADQLAEGVHPMTEIDRHIPRGAAIERILNDVRLSP